MKRALLLVAICLAGLQACDNIEQEQLTPMEIEILEIDDLIASQAETGFDEQELLNDLKTGTINETAYFQYKNGKLVQSSYDDIDGKVIPHYIFLSDGTCRKCFIQGAFSNILGTSFAYINFDWEYNPQTKSIETKFNELDGDFSFSAKVVYYNKESGKLILEGNLCDCIGVYGGGEPVADYSRMTFHIDLNPETREDYLTNYRMYSILKK